jgi:hypothetical protein
MGYFYISLFYQNNPGIGQHPTGPTISAELAGTNWK